MSEPTPTTQGAAFGAPQTVYPPAVQAAPFQPPAAEALQQPVPPVEATITPVPAEHRAKLTDRLKKRQVKTKLVDLGDGDVVLVRGMDVVAVEAMNESMREEDEELEPGATPKLTKTNPRMLRHMCFDPETGESVYGTGRQIGVDPETDQPIIDGWTDAEINAQPMDVVNQLMTAVNEVMGRTSEPGKDSLSTGGAASSSS